MIDEYSVLGFVKKETKQLLKEPIDKGMSKEALGIDFLLDPAIRKIRKQFESYEITPRDIIFPPFMANSGTNKTPMAE